jgi:microcystin-dependent protein
MMKRIKELLNDLGGVATAGGTANAVTVTSSSPFTAYASGLRVTFKAVSDNTAATTLSVNSIGAKSIRKFTLAGEVALSGGEIQEDGIYELIYNAALNSAAGGWLLLNPSQVDVVQPGIIMPFGGTTAPLGTLPCDGTAVSRTTYAALFAAIGTTWGVGNGTTTFNVPDLRNDFLRGASGTLTVGTKQTDALKTHTHTGTTSSDGTHSHNVYGGNGENTAVRGIGKSDANGIGGLTDTSGNTYHSTLGGNGTQIIQNGGAHTHTFTTGSTGDAETRPRNGVVLWVIKT